MSPAQALAILADEELALVLDGRVDDLDELHARRETLMEDVMRIARGTLPEGDVHALHHAAGVQQIVTLALADRSGAVRAELAGLHRGRAAAHGYGATSA